MLYLSYKQHFTSKKKKKKKKKKGLNRHKFLFCHVGNFCFMFVWLRVSSYFLGPSVLCYSFILFFFLFVFCFFFFWLLSFAFFCQFYPFFFLLKFGFFFLAFMPSIEESHPIIPSSFIWAWDQQDFSGMYRSILAELYVRLQSI